MTKFEQATCCDSTEHTGGKCNFDAQNSTKLGKKNTNVLKNRLKIVFELKKIKCLENIPKKYVFNYCDQFDYE